MQDFATTGSVEPPATTRVIEHGLVRTRRALETTEGIVPAGTRGTIVHIFRDGNAVMVEFARPVVCVEAIELVDLLLE